MLFSLIFIQILKNSTTPDDDPSPLTELFGTAGDGGILGAAKNLLGGLIRK
jgi:hypothetical protein